MDCPEQVVKMFFFVNIHRDIVISWLVVFEKTSIQLKTGILKTFKKNNKNPLQRKILCYNTDKLKS